MLTLMLRKASVLRQENLVLVLVTRKEYVATYTNRTVIKYNIIDR